eukprot:UN25110
MKIGCQATDPDDPELQKCPWYIKFNDNLKAVAEDVNAQGVLSAAQTAQCTEKVDHRAYECPIFEEKMMQVIINNGNLVDSLERRISPVSLSRYKQVDITEDNTVESIDVMGGAIFMIPMIINYEQTFASQVFGRSRYRIDMAATNPSQLNIELHARTSDWDNRQGVIFDVTYQSPLDIDVFVCHISGDPCELSERSMELEPEDSWFDSADTSAGTYLFNRLEKRVSVLVEGSMSDPYNPGVMVKLNANPALEVQMGVRMSVEDFFLNVDDFVNNLASVLGIGSDRIKVVDVVPGDYNRIGTRRFLQEDGGDAVVTT